MDTSKLPAGESYVVAVDGEYRHYKTLKGAQDRLAKLREEGKEGMLSTYNLTEELTA